MFGDYSIVHAPTLDPVLADATRLIQLTTLQALAVSEAIGLRFEPDVIANGSREWWAYATRVGSGQSVAFTFTIDERGRAFARVSLRGPHSMFENALQDAVRAFKSYTPPVLRAVA